MTDEVTVVAGEGLRVTREERCSSNERRDVKLQLYVCQAVRRSGAMAAATLGVTGSYFALENGAACGERANCWVQRPAWWLQRRCCIARASTSTLEVRSVGIRYTASGPGQWAYASERGAGDEE
ncbi:MAG: hypothetical protein ACJ796_11865 [Gemmatimonadaceae bacterium]